MIPLFSISQVKEADNYAVDKLGIPGLVLMENASISIYNITREKYDIIENDLVGFVCGKGNNGGDGFAVARHFLNNGIKVKVICLCGENELIGDALKNFLILKKLIACNPSSKLIKYNSVKDIHSLNKCKIVFDAILGTGARGNLKSPYAEIVNELNKLHTIRVAIDIPTGLDADTGFGETVYNADLTISLAELKRGLFINDGALYSGEVKKGYIGVPQNYFDLLIVNEYLIEPEDVISFLPKKKKDLHKYSAGKVVVLAGSANVPGAAFLCSNAVLNSGAGAAYLCFPKSVKTLAQRKVTEVIIESYDDEKKGIYRTVNMKELHSRFNWTDVLAIGPGMGRDEETINAILETIKKFKSKRVILDADALYALSNNRYKNYDLKNFILTPHHGEFANLLGMTSKELKQNMLEIGKAFAKDKECFLILKGAPTVIFNPFGEAFINTTGNAGMAKFGTGDVLTGVIAGFLAQSKNIEEAVISAVYIHSLAADLLLKEKTEYSIIASQISDNISCAIRFLRSSVV